MLLFIVEIEYNKPLEPYLDTLNQNFDYAGESYSETELLLIQKLNRRTKSISDVNIIFSKLFSLLDEESCIEIDSKFEYLKSSEEYDDFFDDIGFCIGIEYFRPMGDFIEITAISWDKMKEKHPSYSEYESWNHNTSLLQGEYSFKIDFIAWSQSSGKNAGIHLFISVDGLKLKTFIYFNQKSYTKHWNIDTLYKGFFGPKKFEVIHQ
ncbi:hypothetical protein PQO01_07115 [Lentisphaera marina]|uniref:hypothetical protein n=1 Tax=Lentisphaera marina TaxID=1111041 RepID=UPI002365FC29|nr:hypothetical protein [Lentisphaera marina]MDD7984717.1 hypothetical protein [Lentisphaera marina]